MYNDYFGFAESPFNITPDPRFFYPAPASLEAYATLRYGVQEKKGFVAVTAEVGTGKTTLLRKLMHELKNRIQFALIINTHLTFDELLKTTLHDLGLPAESNERLGMIEELNGFLLRQVDRGQTFCLLVDEAQNLSDEALEGLRLLSNLETDRQKLLQIVLMGQPELNTKLERPNLRQLKQRIAIRCDILPLKDDEVARYVKFRLGVAGCKDKHLFEPAALDSIAIYSNGIPRLINVICDNACLIAFAGSRKTVSADIIEEVAADLRLRSISVQPPSPAVAPPETNGSDGEFVPVPIRALPAARPRRAGMKARVGTFSVILVSLAATCLIDPELVLTNAARSYERVKHNSRQWRLLFSGYEPPSSAPPAQLATVGPKPRPVQEARAHRVTIQQGATVFTIASDAYGSNAVLGMDLMQQLNPDIPNLDWVAAGEELLLPPIARDTLLHRENNGSYRLIADSFLSRKQADELAGKVAAAGYHTRVTPHKISNNLILYRLEIESLADLAQADRALDASVKNGWIRIPAQTVPIADFRATARAD